MHLRAEDQRLGAARARTEPHVLLREFVPLVRFGMRRQRQADRVVLHRPRHRHFARGLAHLQDLALRQHPIHLGLARVGRPIEHFVQFVHAWKAHLQLEEEPVELRFGQRIRTLHLERVHGGQHEERLLQRMRGLARGHAVLLHRLEQRRLRLGCGAVDLVRQHHVREDRPGLELEILLAAFVLAHDRRAHDVARHQVGRELDARELEMQHVRQGLHQLGLAHTRDALEQHVAARQQAGHHAVDHGVVADDHAAHFGAHQAHVLLELFDPAIDLDGAHLASCSRNWVK